MLGIVKALGKGIELTPKLAELVRAGYREAVLIVPAGDDAHGIGKIVQALEDDRGIDHSHHERRKGDQERDCAYLHLKVVYDAAALGVRLMQVHCPSDGALAADWDGVAAGKGLVLLRGAEHRLAAESGEQIARGGLGSCVRLRIVYYVPGLPGNYYPVIALNVEKAQHLGNALLIGIIKARKRGGKRRGLTLHGLFLLLKHSVARGDERIDIQQQEQDQQQHR